MFYDNNRTLVLKNPKREKKWLAIVGIPIKAKPGIHKIKILLAKNINVMFFSFFFFIEYFICLSKPK